MNNHRTRKTKQTQPKLQAVDSQSEHARRTDQAKMPGPTAQREMKTDRCQTESETPPRPIKGCANDNREPADLIEGKVNDHRHCRFRP